MSDVKCPYCGEYNEICHDDGYGYDEDKEYEQECSHCEKTFVFTTQISFWHNVYCQDGDHDLKQSRSERYLECTKCDYVKMIEEKE
jgi:hypothetical protein